MVVDLKNRFTQDNSSTSHLKMMPLRWGGHIGGSHIERDTQQETLASMLRTIFNDGDTIQYRLLNTTMYTGDDIYYVPKMKRGE